MSMNEENASNPGESWSPPEDESAGLNMAAPGQQPNGANSPEDESAGLNTAVPGQQPGATNPWEDNPIHRGVKRIASYLMGAGATAPPEAEKLVEKLKQQGMTDDDANLLAIHEAAATGGPAAAWAMIQYNRGAFNAKQSFARVALNGIDGKAGDISSAADAATKAGAHVPDGSSVSFHADKWGVTATVSLPGTSQRQTFDMTPQQFDQYLDLSKTSQWDRLMEEGGIPVALTKVGAKLLRGGDQSADDNASMGIPKDDGSQPGYNPGTAPDSEAVKTGKATARDVTEGDQQAISGTHDEHGHYLGPQDKDRTNYGDELEARSEKVFGKGNVNAEPARQQWMAAQEEKELERGNKVDVAHEKGINDREKAKIAAGGRVQSAEVTAEGRKATAAGRLAYLRDDLNRKTQAMSQGHQDAAMRERGRLARAELLTNPGIDEAGLAKIYARHGIQLPQGGTPTSVAPTQAPAQQGKKFYNGKWYTKDEYMRDVLGQGQ